MLAAAPIIQSNSLDLFKLALFLVESKEQNIPTSLKTYFSEILSQAKSIAKNPASVSRSTSPEAIELAVDIREIADFLQVLENIQTIDAVSPEQAKQILNKMEVSSVYQDGFSSVAELAG